MEQNNDLALLTETNKRGSIVHQKNPKTKSKRASTDFRGESGQISKIVPVDATIYVEKSAITVSNL